MGPPIVRSADIRRHPDVRRYPDNRRHPDIRRSKSLGATGELHSLPGMDKAASPHTAVILLSIPHHRALPYVVLYRGPRARNLRKKRVHLYCTMYLHLGLGRGRRASHPGLWASADTQARSASKDRCI